MAELADAPDLGSGGRNPVWVQVPLRALKILQETRNKKQETRNKIQDTRYKILSINRSFIPEI